VEQSISFIQRNEKQALKQTLAGAPATASVHRWRNPVARAVIKVQ